MSVSKTRTEAKPQNVISNRADELTADKIMADKQTPEEIEAWKYSYLYDSLILFSLDYDSLVKMAGPLFNPLGELISCWTYAFEDIYQDVLATKRIKESGVTDQLNKFNAKLISAPDNLWEYDELKNNSFWDEIRREADDILNKLGETKDRQFEKKQS